MNAGEAETGRDAIRVSAGRFSMDAPAVTRLSFAKAEIADIQLRWIPLPAGQSFTVWLAKRTAEIREGKMSSGRQSSLIRSYTLAPDLPAVLYWAYPDQNPQRLEAYRDFGDHVLLGTTDGYPNELPISEKLMPSVMSSFQKTTFGAAVPDGFAVEGGVIHREFQSNELVDATAILHLPAAGDDLDHPVKLQVNTEIFSNAATSTLPGRLSRTQTMIAAMQAQAPGLRIKSLRSGSRVVAGLKGDESFFVIHDPRNHPDTYSAKGEFEFGGDADNPIRPYLQITLDVPSLPDSFNSAELLTLWDQTLRTASFHR